MTCMLLEKPDAVFIHIPKCAGTSIRALWDYRIKGRAFGHVPKDWRDKPAFAVIREPRSRFLSAVRMFKFGNSDHESYYQRPVWPELTIEIALKVLQDDKIPFDRAQRNLEGNFKHHIIAQTHPYNCLDQADFILRQENLTQDFDKLRQRFGFTGTLPHVRKAEAVSNKLLPTEAETRQIKAAFHEDYAQLGYNPDSHETGPVALPPASTPTFWSLWPFFFSDQRAAIKRAGIVLPEEDVDLIPFAERKITGQSGGTWPGRERDLNKHFHRLLPEFIGRSWLSFLLACCIVTIRRTQGNGPGIVLFHRIITEHYHQICPDLNTRWLVSVCDTLVDHGTNPTQRAIGLSGSLLANTVKLSETERRLFYPKRPWPPKAHANKLNNPMFDGVIAFWLGKGDMIRNLFDRIGTISEDDPVAGSFVAEIMMRMMQHDTVFRRISEISNNSKALPLVDERVRKKLERIAQRWL
ncbi:MAG: sulfotransferase family protein [Rhodobacteraceae bacterium]|nr:sulfotransferase family protein [Paracoccaceae bacterium]